MGASMSNFRLEAVKDAWKKLEDVLTVTRHISASDPPLSTTGQCHCSYGGHHASSAAWHRKSGRLLMFFEIIRVTWYYGLLMFTKLTMVI